MAYGERTVWIGYDEREVLPYAVARHSVKTWADRSTTVHGVVLSHLVDWGWYKRKTEVMYPEQGGEILWDAISGAPMSTQFAISRFFVPHLIKKAWPSKGGWALFVDCDVLVRTYLSDLFFAAEQQPDKALVCVSHNHIVVEGEAKKEAQIQQNYARKNWSSVMLFNRNHPSNEKLTIEMLNTLPGRDLHRFCWLKDHEIGFVDKKWNHLVGVPSSEVENPAIVHFTNGGPWLPKYVTVPYADEWREAFNDWVK
jgi:lipopolysaccharide biosynthesis glycosyltransferase